LDADLANRDRFNYGGSDLDWATDWASDRLDDYLCKHPQLNPAELQRLHSLKSKLNHPTFEIVALGLVSSGKTSVLNALQGKRVGVTSPLHGTTKAVDTSLGAWQIAGNPKAIAPEPTSAADSLQINPQKAESKKIEVKLIDTPGLDEVTGEVRAEMATTAARQGDLILFVTAGTLTRQELEAIAQLQQFKPILLISNKSDLYPDGDRQLLHKALQDSELQNLISPDEIVFTSAEPLPRRVRVQYGDRSQEIWEPKATDVKALKQKILDLLNQDGKALLALNTLRSLWEIQINVTQRRLDRLPLRAISSWVFMLKAIIILILPSSVLDFILSILIDGSLVQAATNLGYVNRKTGLSLSVTSATILINIQNHYGQIIWLGMTTVLLIDWLRQDLLKAHILKQFVKKLQTALSPSSIIHRLKFKF
jgi:uncharacterized protein